MRINLKNSRKVSIISLTITIKFFGGWKHGKACEGVSERASLVKGRHEHRKYTNFKNTLIHSIFGIKYSQLLDIPLRQFQ